MPAQLAALMALLAGRGFGVEVCYTTAAADSVRELAAAAAETSDLVLACGGDGTVHGAVQGLAGTRAALGVLPLGTANALARNLRLPLDPVAALTALLGYTARAIPLGEITTATRTRLFAVMAGCGPDGALVHALDPGQKSRFGRHAYYGHAARLFLTRRWPAFAVEYRVAGDAGWQRAEAAALMASRIPDLGGLFSGLTPAARLTDGTLHVHLLRAPAQVSFPAWFALSRARLPNPLLTTVDVEELRAEPLGVSPVYAQADGEPMGALPVRLRIAAATLNLLMPAE
jgi:diacylglycerol kinase family enzyme